MVVLSGVVFVIPSVAYANYSCGATGNFHDGYYSTPASTSRKNLFGVKARLDVQLAHYCSGGNSSNFTNVYAMSRAADGVGWSQAGYERGSANGSHPGIHNFAQIYNPATPYHFSTLTTWYSKNKIATGKDRTYKIQDFNTAPYLETTYDFVSGNAVLVGSTDGWATPFEIELAGEARYRGDDIAGTSNNRLNLIHLKFQDKSYNWHPLPSGIFFTHVDSSHWHHHAVSATHKQFWSNPTN